MEWQQREFVITDDRSRVDIEVLTRLLRNSYWAWWRPTEMIARSVEGSLCFSLLRGAQMIGFARAVTDQATFTWIADVIIDPGYRGRGFGRWLISCVLEHPDLRDTQIILKTRDAHDLYERFGFERDNCMRRRSPLYQASPPVPLDVPNA